MSNTTLTTTHTTHIRHWFNLPPTGGRRSRNAASQPPPPRCPLAPPVPGQLYLITGPSGSGKSRLLRRLRYRWRNLFIILNLDTMKLPNHPTIDCFPHLPLAQALHHLSRVGLAEAHTWLLPPRLLSQGQRWRLKLALALTYAHSTPRPALLCADEFASCLDPLTARIIAHTLRRQLDQLPTLCVLLATPRSDLPSALHPAQIIQCDFDSIQLRPP